MGIGVAATSLIIFSILYNFPSSENQVAADSYKDLRIKELEKRLEKIESIVNDKLENRVDFVNQSSLFNIFGYDKDTFQKGGKTVYNRVFYELKPENTDLYRDIGIKDEQQNTVVVLPIFTTTAYAVPGFYNYYKQQCDASCITNIPIRYDHPQKYQTSDSATKVLKLLGYSFITDIEIDKNPNILANFDKVILLHNEYVTKKEFDAITQHPKVIYLYPNALYAEIDVNYELESITLIRGHSFPSEEISNGFDREFDNTHPFESDTKCKNWEFYEIDNGVMLNCYPENVIHKNTELLKFIKNY